MKEFCIAGWRYSSPFKPSGGDNAGNIPDFLKICAGVGIGRALHKAGKSLDEIATDADATIKAPV